MNCALDEAKAAFKKNEVPVGAVIVQNNQVIAKAHNFSITQNNPIAHAEILVIQEAGKILQTEKLIDCEIYITLQPCMMCISAINLAKIKRVIYGAKQDEGNHSYLLENSDIEIIGGVLEKQSQELLGQFFKKKRQLQQQTNN